MKPTTRARAFALIHHFLLAATISSLLLALHATPFFPLLDNATYSVVAMARKATAPTSAPARWSEDEYPLVVMLAPRLLEGPEGPKVRPTRLLRVIEQAAKVPQSGERSRVLAFVLDLAPWPGDVLSDRTEQGELDGALAQIRRKMRVVLLAPNVWSEDQVGRERFRWLIAQCAAGIEFALPEPRKLGRPIYGYRPHFESVGVLASIRASAHPPIRGTDPKVRFNVCDVATRNGGNIAEFQNQAGAAMKHIHDVYERPLNSAYFDFNGNLAHTDALMPTEWGSTPALPMGKLSRAQAIFIGVADFQFATTTMDGDPIYPADIQAAEFFTEAHPVRPVALTGAFVLDVGLGILLGYLFAFLWEKYGRAAARFEATPLFPWRRKLLMYLGVRGGLLGLNLAVLGFVIWCIFKLAGVALDYQLWLNPFPIVLGTCIDGLLHSRRRPETEEPHDVHSFLTKHFDVFAQTVIIVVALGWVVVYSMRIGH